MIKLTLLHSTSKHVEDTMSLTSLIAGYKTTQDFVFFATVVIIFSLIAVVVIRDQKNKAG